MDRDWPVLILFVMVVFIAIFGSVDLIAGIIIGALAAPWIAEKCRSGQRKYSEGFEGREVLLDECVDDESTGNEAVEQPYFPVFGSNFGYTECYPPVAQEFNADTCRTMSVDEKATVLSELRQRDKKCLDGWASKNANFYKKNFSDELDKSERKRWWGQNEY